MPEMASDIWLRLRWLRLRLREVGSPAPSAADAKCAGTINVLIRRLAQVANLARWCRSSVVPLHVRFVPPGSECKGLAPDDKKGAPFTRRGRPHLAEVQPAVTLTTQMPS